MLILLAGPRNMRRRINTEEKAKVLAALAILHEDVLKNRTSSSYSSNGMYASVSQSGKWKVIDFFRLPELHDFASKKSSTGRSYI